MRINLRHTSAAGLIHAGSGESLAEAREARFLETAKARVALISCASTFPDHSRAGKSRDDIPARPGLNPMRYEKRYQVTNEQLSQLKAINKDLGGADRGSTLFGQKFEVGGTPDEITEPNMEDLEAIAAVVRNASGLSDITIVTIHGHERYKELEVPAQFLETFARAMIDAGADIVVGHGPHVLRGIEIYKNKPIFYSLGDFIFQNETLLRLPYENYERYALDENNHVSDFNALRYNNDSTGFPSSPKVWESVIAVPTWRQGELSTIVLHPITLGHGQPRQVRGRPMIADEKLGKKIINDLTDLSAPYGTTVTWNGSVGVVKLK
jgi:poly-gamma-glutamate synthesis protein (capsule biosynthesis protein)